MQNKLASAIETYWRSGAVSALVLMDIFVLIICFIDIVRFSIQGLSFGSALQVTVQIASHDHSLVLLAATVFLFFSIGMPVALALISLFWPSERWPKIFGKKGNLVLGAHVVLSLTIACFSATAVVMEVLSGWSATTEAGHVPEYSFTSFWLFAVFWCRFISVAYLSPIVKKIFWRAAAERHGKGSAPGLVLETAKEVITEHGIHEG